jgi:hypothetical protein
MVEVAGSEPAPRTGMTGEKINENNEVSSSLTSFIAICSRGFGGQSVAGQASSGSIKSGDFGGQRDTRMPFTHFDAG